MNLMRLLTIQMLWIALLGGSNAMAVEDASSIPALTYRLTLGYRAVSNDNYARRAAPYSLLESGPTANFDLKYLDPTLRFMFLGTYLDEADYLIETDFDYRGLLRINIDNEKLIHNLDHYSYDRPEADSNGTPITFSDSDVDDDYFVEVAIDKVNVKAKLPDYPAHLTLGYWRLKRSGKKQLRYLDEGGDATTCTRCHMASKTQTIDRVTEEVTIGLDTHVGYLNLAVEQLFREFRDQESAPYDSFGTTQNDFGLLPVRDSGFYSHDATPDSRLVSTTIKASTSPSGGLIAAAGYTIGKKENLSDDVLGVSSVESETDFHKASADLTLIPDPKWTLNFKYRMLDQDNDTPSQVSVDGLDPTVVDVRSNIDITRATYKAKVSYRPIAKLTLMGEFEHKNIHRSQTGTTVDDTFDPFWELPEDENVNQFRLSFITRPLGPSTLRINGWYEYLISDDPAYGTSVEEQHEFFAGVNWTPSAHLGATANIHLSRGVNNNYDRSEYDSSGTLWEYEIDRNQQQENFTFGVWSQLTDALNINLNYGYLRSDTSQDVTFGAGSNSLVNSEYRQRVHTATFSTGLRLTENLQALMETRYIRSKALFDPDFVPEDIFGLSIDTSDLSELSELDIVQVGIALGLEWTLANDWTCSANFSHDDYEARNNSEFDGTAQLYTFSIARSW